MRESVWWGCGGVGQREGELFIQEGNRERERELVLITEVYYIVIGLSLTA